MLRQPADIKNSNVWEQAGKAKKKDITAQGYQKTIIVIGQQGCGKSSFIKLIRGDLQFDTKPTCLLEYSYIKRLSLKKQIIHSYELASKNLSSVIPSIITKDNFNDFYFIICVDLSKPSTIVDDLNDAFATIRKQFSIFHKEKLLNRQDRYREFEDQIIQKISILEDRTSITPMPLNTIVIGCKYDLLQKFDTQNRKWIGRCLRYQSHINNASLYYCSTKNMQVGAQIRSILSQHFFGEKKTQFASQKDHTKPIFIMNGQDDINSMNLPSSGSLSITEILKKQISSIFPPQAQKKKQQIDLTKYNETKIDSLIQAKRNEILKIAKALRQSQI